MDGKQRGDVDISADGDVATSRMPLARVHALFDQLVDVGEHLAAGRSLEPWRSNDALSRCPTSCMRSSAAAASSEGPLLGGCYTAASAAGRSVA